MKPYNFKVSVINGSDEVIAQSGTNWNGVSERCYIRIQKDTISYSIKSIEDFKISEKFSVKDGKSLVIEDDSTSSYILRGDECELVFKEYEVFEVENIVESGTGYEKGDIVYLSGGKVVESFSGISDNRASFEITNVGSKGQIKMIRLKNSGRYSEVPNESNLVFTERKGTGAELKIEFKSKSDRTILRREIVDKIISKDSVILLLDSTVPNNETSGVLTISKQKLTLESDYLGVSNDSAGHEIIRDFTPNYRLPFASPNSQNLEFVFNQSMSLIDKQLSLLDKRIRELKN